MTFQTHNINLIGFAFTAAMGLSSTAATAEGHAGGTLASVLEKGFVQCGVTGGVPGFSAQNSDNEWAGLEVDYCRALAAAIFDNAEAVRYTPLTSQERFTALSSGAIDILSRTTSWTMSHDTKLGISFVGTMFYDGQGFMVRAADGFESALDLDGADVCIEAGTTTELNVVDYFITNEMNFNAQVFVDQAEVVKAYEDGLCNVYTTDSSALAAERTILADPSAHVILPEIISKEALGPSVRSGDSTWFNVARWTYFALLEAEELGVSSSNIDDLLGSENPAIKRLLGVEGELGTAINLTPDWAYRIIKHVGNYGESFERHVGTGTLIGLERGVNDLWTRGGLQYSPPIR